MQHAAAELPPETAETPGKAPEMAPGMESRIAAFDWSRTPLGPADRWPAHLRNTLALILRSPVAMATLWGSDGIMIYNDAYAAIAGKRHPFALGCAVALAWPEIAAFNAQVLRVVLAGQPLSYRDQPLALERDGVTEEAWFDLDYSPIPNEAGDPAGVLAIVTETTAKVLAQRRADAEHERLREMFEQAPGFFAMLRGPDHVFEMANAACRELLGHREVLGKSLREAMPDLAGQGYHELLDRVYASGESHVGRESPVLLRRDPDAPPREVFVDMLCHPMRDPAGAVSGILVQGLDVTGRVLAERDRRASDDLFRSLAEAMPNHVWTAPADGRLDWFNARTYEYSGAAPGALDGDGWAEIVHPEDIAGAQALWAEAVATGTTYETEFRLRRADGVYRWHIARAVLLRDAAGRPARWVGTNTDFEDQRNVRHQLARSERMLRLSQQAAGIASMEIDLASDRISGTANLWEIFGLPVQASAPASELEALVLPEDRGAASSPDTRKSGAAPPDTEYRIRRADNGEIRWLSRNLEYVRDGKGRPLRIFGAVRDITHQKEGIARQEMLTHELEHRIKNILATVSAIANQTLRKGDLASARKALLARLTALGDAHAMLSSTHWTSAELVEVVRRASTALPSDRVRMSGPAVRLGPKRALSLALAVNELGTNALKYGALSVPDGRVEITWSWREATPGNTELVWTWHEKDGPAVTPPSRNGFGRFLIEQVMAGDFGGTVTLAFEPGGLHCRLVAPWRDSGLSRPG